MAQIGSHGITVNEERREEIGLGRKTAHEYTLAGQMGK